MTTLTWYIAQVTQAGRRAAIALREHHFTVYCPMERIYKSVPKAPREEVERPLFPGYLFVGLGPWNDYDQLYDIDGLTKIVETKLSKERLASLVYQLMARQCAGEFDQTTSHRYLPPKPLVGSMNRSVGHGLTALGKLLKADPSGRLDLVLSGELDGEIDESWQEAA